VAKRTSSNVPTGGKEGIRLGMRSLQQKPNMKMGGLRDQEPSVACTGRHIPMGGGRLRGTGKWAQKI